MRKLILPLITLITITCHAEEFDSNFLVGNATGHSVEQAETIGFINGQYLVNIYVNGEYITEKNVEIIKKNDSSLQSCLSKKDLETFGILNDINVSGKCNPVNNWVSGASDIYDENTHTLNLSVPDAALAKDEKYRSSPGRWDYGESMLYSNYLASVNSNTSANGRNYNTAFIDLENGLNFGSWQLHNRTTTVSAFNVTKTYLRDIYVEKPLPESQMIFRSGRSYFSGQGIDSFSYKGLSFSSDDSMLNRSMVEYTPVVTGTITSQAKVVVLQQNNVIYQGVFPPGQYKISSLKLLNEYDALNIYVYEAGKSPYRYSMPVHSASTLLKPGRKKWSFTTGQTALNKNYYRSAQFAGFSYSQGISNSFSLNGGALVLSSSYAALTGGGDLYTVGGVFSGKVSFTKKEDSGKDSSAGIILNTSYNKILESMDLNVSSGFTRYSKGGTSGVEGSLARNKYTSFTEKLFYPTVRNEFDININKSSEVGNFSLQVSSLDYYRRHGRDYRYGAYYQYYVGDCSLNLALNRTLYEFSPGETSYGLSVSLPISIGRKKYYTDSGMTATRQTATLHSGASSTFGTNDKNNYNIFTGRELKGDSGSRQEIGGSVSFDEPSSNTTVGVTKSADFRQFSANTSGSLVIHKEGVTFGKTLGKSFALVDAPGAGGASIDNGSTILDKNGYALVTSLAPYTENLVNISPGKMKQDVEIPNTSKSVIPVSGAALRLHYTTITGVPVLVKILNRSLPVGLTVRDDKGNSAGMTGQSSLIYLRQPSENKSYSVAWGDEKNQRCYFSVILTSQDLSKNFIKKGIKCL